MSLLNDIFIYDKVESERNVRIRVVVKDTRVIVCAIYEKGMGDGTIQHMKGKGFDFVIPRCRR